MTNEITNSYESIDLCACFDMIFAPPAAVIRAWEKEWEERFIANKERDFYGTELDGTLYYYYGNTRTKVTEFFSPNEQTLDKVIENLVCVVSGQTVSASISMNC